MRRVLLFAILVLSTHLMRAQGVGINNATPDPSALLDLTSTDRGLLVPRLTTVQRDGIPVPALSLLIYNTSNTRFEYFNGTAWVPLVVSGGTLDQAYNFGGPGLGRTIVADAGAVRIEGVDGLLSTGTLGNGAIPQEGPGVRMVWYPGKAAFRAGQVNGTQWNDAEVGLRSAAFGNNSTAAGSNSFATASGIASGDNAFAVKGTASGESAVSLGGIASGMYATSAGMMTNASGSWSTALGYLNTTSGMSATALGYSNTATGQVSMAMGSSNNAFGSTSTAMGVSNTAAGDASLATGRNNTASSYGETVLGIGATQYVPSVNGATQFRLANANDRLLVVGNALDLNNNSLVDLTERSDALVILKNGNTGVGVSVPTQRLHVAGNIRMVDGNQAAGSVMVSAADGTASWALATSTASGTLDQAYDFGGAGVGRTITADAGAVQITGVDGFVSTGSFGSGAIPAMGAGVRMMWYPRKAAFRAGSTGTTQWEDANIGDHSAAWGTQTTASGYASTACGVLTTASGSNSMALGHSTTAGPGSSATAWGFGSTALSQGSTAWGNNTLAEGLYCTAWGDETVAGGARSTTWGQFTTASNNLATAWGIGSMASGSVATAWGSGQATGSASTAWGDGTASGANATAWGSFTEANGQFSTASGRSNVAVSYAETVLGIGATTYTSSVNGASQFRAANATDRLLVVGNAIDANNNNLVDAAERRNALLILKNGNTTIGNADPNTRLDVVAGTTGTTTRVMTVRSAFTANNTGTGIALINSTGNGSDVGSEIISVTTNAASGLSDLRFHVHGGGGVNGALNERVRILGNGNVGIGVVAPTQRLHVEGSIRMVDGNQGAGRVMTSAVDGTASWQVPTAASVTAWGLNGNTILATHVLGSTNNVSLKFMVNSQTAGAVSNTGLTTFLGYRAGENNTGVSNTFIGYFSGLANTTGANNTFLGVGAGENNVDGSEGCFLGRAAGILNTSGSRNTFVGRFAGSTNTTGQDNSVLGWGAGNSSATHSSSTFLGFDADGNNATGRTNSTAIGNASRVTADNQVRIGNNLVTSIGGFADWTNVSDGTFKTEVRESVPGLEFILALRPVNYRLDRGMIDRHLNIENSASGGYSDVQTGFIAQEVEAAAKAVGFDFSGVDAPKNADDFYGLRYATFTVPLVKAVQEQQTTIEELREELARMRTELDSLRNGR